MQRVVYLILLILVSLPIYSIPPLKYKWIDADVIALVKLVEKVEFDCYLAEVIDVIKSDQYVRVGQTILIWENQKRYPMLSINRSWVHEKERSDYYRAINIEDVSNIKLKRIVRNCEQGDTILATLNEIRGITSTSNHRIDFSKGIKDCYKLDIKSSALVEGDSCTIFSFFEASFPLWINSDDEIKYDDLKQMISDFLNEEKK